MESYSYLLSPTNKSDTIHYSHHCLLDNLHKISNTQACYCMCIFYTQTVDHNQNVPNKPQIDISLIALSISLRHSQQTLYHP